MHRPMLAVFAALLLAGCGAASTPVPLKTPDVVADVETETANIKATTGALGDTINLAQATIDARKTGVRSPDGQTAEISREDFGDDWPFTVDSGVLICEGSNGKGAVTFEVGTSVYSVNGTAKEMGRGRDIKPIWRKAAGQAGAAGLYQNIGPVLDRGLALCK